MNISSISGESRARRKEKSWKPVGFSSIFFFFPSWLLAPLLGFDGEEEEEVSPADGDGDGGEGDFYFLGC